MTKKHKKLIETAQRQLDNDGRLKDVTYHAMGREVHKIANGDAGNPRGDTVALNAMFDLLHNG